MAIITLTVDGATLRDSQTMEQSMTEKLHGSVRRARSSSEFVAVIEKTLTCMDQMLFYRGTDRFVVFYYEPRAEEVIWRDSHSYGFVTGAWSTFMEEVAPVAEHYNVDVGCNDRPPSHVLLIDRAEHKAYFAVRADAMKFLAQVLDEKFAAGDETREMMPMQVPPAMVEITNEEITKLAHQIWQRKGCPVGRDLEVWLEAEAELKASLTGARR
jgi:hypothetical protein